MQQQTLQSEVWVLDSVKAKCHNQQLQKQQLPNGSATA